MVLIAGRFRYFKERQRQLSNIVLGHSKIKRDRIWKKGKTVQFSIVALFLTIIIIFIISFFNKYQNDDYIVRAWTQYEMDLISSGAPPEADIDIETNKQQEVSEWIECINEDPFRIYLNCGSFTYSISFSDNGTFFHKDRINRSY